MSNAQNLSVYESTASYTTIWTETNWKKVYKYVDKQLFRIFRAESETMDIDHELFQIKVYLSRMS